MRLFIALMFVTLNVFAATGWNDLEIDQNYKITQSFQLKSNSPGGSMLDIVEKQNFVLKDIIGLEQINVMLFQFAYKNCPGPQMTTEMEIIPVKNTAPVVEIGAQLVENCTLEIYIEVKDLMKSSFFE